MSEIVGAMGFTHSQDRRGRKNRTRGEDFRRGNRTPWTVTTEKDGMRNICKEWQYRPPPSLHRLFLEKRFREEKSKQKDNHPQSFHIFGCSQQWMYQCSFLWVTRVWHDYHSTTKCRLPHLTCSSQLIGRLSMLPSLFRGGNSHRKVIFLKNKTGEVVSCSGSLHVLFAVEVNEQGKSWRHGEQSSCWRRDERMCVWEDMIQIRRVCLREGEDGEVWQACKLSGRKKKEARGNHKDGRTIRNNGMHSSV